MSWLYSQALVEEYLEGNSSDGEQYAPLNTTNTPEMYLWQGKTTEASNLSRYGMMCQPLTDDSGEAVLMSFLEDFHVKTSVAPEKVEVSTENDQGSGKKWQGSLARYDRDTASWRIAQCSLLGDLEQFSETWPRWGMMQNGECWELAMPDLHIKESGYGYWPTPTKSDGDQHGKEKWIKNSRAKRISLGKSPPTEKLTYVYFESGIPMKYFPEISEDAMMWPRGWTDLRALETGRFQEWLLSHGNC